MRRIQLLHGTRAANDAFIGRKGELTINTDDYSIRVHDGKTAGGHTVGIKDSALRKLFIDIAHPVGSWYASDDPTDPSELFEGTTWVRLTGKKGLIACTDDLPVGSEGGSDVLTEAMLPAHTHSATTDTQGAHSHDRGDMNIWGAMSGIVTESSGADGAISCTQTGTAYASGKGKQFRDLYFNGCNSWGGSTNSTGGHSHNITVGSTGSGAEAMNPYHATYIWKRIS